MKARTSCLVAAFALALLLSVASLEARNVDLATVPPRETVQLTIYNSEDLTLVRETRSLTLKGGINRIQYSWANTLIDPTSVEIRPLEQEESIEVLDTTFPGDKPQHLIWNIQSEAEGQVKFQVTYFTSGISWSADYVVVTDPGETQMSLDGYVQVHNRSGEDYENAQVRLVVGVVNLVEKIQELARRGILKEEKGGEALGRRLAMRESLEEADRLAGTHVRWDSGGAPPEIVKEGLSEYFIYTIEGEQTVPDGWSKRMVSFQARQATFDVLYRFRQHQYGPRPVRFFILTNDEEHKLGTTPLPDGLVRVFRDNGKDGLSFLGQEEVTYVPIKEQIEVNLGPDDEVTEERKLMKVERTNFTFERQKLPVPVPRQGRWGQPVPIELVDPDDEEEPGELRVVGWDQTHNWRDEVRNYRDKPIRMELRYIIPGDVELTAEDAKLHDYRTVEFTVDVKANQRSTWEYSYVQHFGKNARQDRITLR